MGTQYGLGVAMGSGAKVQAFTALETCARRKVCFEKVHPAPIQPLLEHLSFTRGHKSWGLACAAALSKSPLRTTVL